MIYQREEIIKFILDYFGPELLAKAKKIDSYANGVQIRGKEAVIAIVLEEEHAETANLAVELFQKSFAYLEMKLVETIIVPGVSDKGDILKKHQQLEEARRIGYGLI